MNALFVGICTPGTTSQLRADTLPRITNSLTWKQIDTDARFRACAKWTRSLAFRFRVGPAVAALNQQVLSELGDDRFEIAWIDKGVCLRPETVREIRRLSRRMVYYTPDTSFAGNRSRFFESTADLYDIVVTTKSFEIDEYRRLIPDERIMLVTQTFDDNAHRPTCEFADKRKEAVLIGLCEPDRERCVAELLSQGIHVRIGGRGWERFLFRHRKDPGLKFEGTEVFGDRYIDALAGASVGLGLLTKRFPELHTTRTFEIPACGTALATERNSETSGVFRDDEAIFFENYEDLGHRLAELLNDAQRLRMISEAGSLRVHAGEFSNLQVIRKILRRLNLPLG